MRIDYHKRFLKHFTHAPRHIQIATSKRIALFLIDPFSRSLRNHALSGRWRGYRSIDITGDWRAIYQELGDGTIEWVEFIELGTHSQLYE